MITKTKIKDYILRHTPFIRSREMFYLTSDTFGVIEPKECFKNMTHREWFSNLGLKTVESWEMITRGYYRNGVLKIFSGADHGLSFITDVKRSVLSVYDYFISKGYNIKEIHVGNIHSTLRTFLNIDWKPIYIVDLDLLKKERLVHLIKYN